MAIRIKQLPSAIANQIAAGEVIERPASVVKELLENSLDAGANHIIVEIGYGGLNQIKISDNGSGIFAEDLPLAVAAHATSKITTLDDLYAIDSMGFRGEALASIASIAKVTISSKPAHQEIAMMLRIQGDECVISPCARSVGTTVDVVDLFFNAPVRKRFLKGEKAEFQAIDNVLKRFALSTPGIAITLKHNNKEVFNLPQALSEQAIHRRMNKIFGSLFMKNALYIDVALGGLALRGWLSGPDYQRSQNDRQWIYINQRMVKDKLINHALKQAYDGLLHPGRFPACLLYFTMNNAEVDVNVHPTKHEVRFQQPRLIHDFFTSQLSKVLKTCPTQEASIADRWSNDAHLQVGEPSAYIKPLGRQPIQTAIALETKHCFDTNNKANVFSPELELPWIVLNNQYILVFLKQQPCIADVKILQQQKTFNQLRQMPLPLPSRPLLVPVILSSSQQKWQFTDELQQNLHRLGLQTELVDEDNLLVRTVPMSLPYLDLPLFFNGLNATVISFEQLLLALSHAQSFDPAYLNQEARAEINQMLLEGYYEEKLQKGCKILTIDDCRVLLNV